MKKIKENTTIFTDYHQFKNSNTRASRKLKKQLKKKKHYEVVSVYKGDSLSHTITLKPILYRKSPN